jgi:uncharacterized phage-associated protein
MSIADIRDSGMSNELKEKEIISASAVTNYLLSEDGELLNGEITNLFLQKAIYFIHSFSLVLIDVAIVNEEFGESIEAWKYGPVIPSLYHEFKVHKGDIIKSGSYSILINETTTEGEEYIKPTIKNRDNIKKVINWVYKNILTNNEKLVTTETLIDIILQVSNSPWQQAFNDYNQMVLNSRNIKIPNHSIKHYFDWYYKRLLNEGLVQKFE